MSSIKDLRVPVWCPVCQLTMKGKSTNTFYDYGACILCFIYFIDGREQKWKSGWRPSSEEIQKRDSDLREP